MKAGLLTGLAAALSIAVPAGAWGADIYVPPRAAVIVPADPYAYEPRATYVVTAPAYDAYAYAPNYAYVPRTTYVAPAPPAYDAYAYAPGYTTVTTVPPYAAPTGYTYTDRYRTVAPGRYVVQQTPSVTVPADPAYVVVERTYAVEAPAAVVVERPARRVRTQRTVVRTVPAYSTVAVPAYRNPVYDQDIRAEYVRPISCAIDAFGVQRCY